MVIFTHPQERVIIITAMNNAPIQVYMISPWWMSYYNKLEQKVVLDEI